MKKPLHPIRGIVSLLMIFILLLPQPGCVTTQIISTADLPSYYPKFTYAIHCAKSVYFLDKIAVTNDTLSGKIDPEPDTLQTIDFINIYPSSDSLVRIDTAMILSIPLAGILKAESRKVDTGKTTLSIIGGVALFILIITFSEIISNWPGIP